MNNIEQITNFDLVGASEVNKEIRIGGDIGKTITYTYQEITSEMLGSNKIFKFGYCTNDNQGMNYPIFLVLDGAEEEIQLGKTGMYEFQSETWKDVNGDNTEREAVVYLEGMLVPKNIPFCLDYCYSV